MPDPDGVRGNMQYPFSGFFPINTPTDITVVWKGKVQPELWPDIVEQSKIKTYRELAGEYEVSYEAIRRVLNAELSKKADCSKGAI